MTKLDDPARVAHDDTPYRERLREFLPELRQSEGFPTGSDEDILALSDPPYYTACPSPFLDEFIAENGTPYNEASDAYQCEPFAADVSEGKTDLLYRAHGYHTKVPHLAIVPYLVHYTQPGDVVVDGFAGSGMTGLAAQWCGVLPDAERFAMEADASERGQPRPEWGARHAVLNDLSPAATFIAAGYTSHFDAPEFMEAAQKLLDAVDDDVGEFYLTHHSDGTQCPVEYTVWSESFSCPQCNSEIRFFDAALDPETYRVRDVVRCAACGVVTSKDQLERRFETVIDPSNGEPWRRISLRPTRISYLYRGRRFEKVPDDADLEQIARVAALPLPPEVPTIELPLKRMTHGSRLSPKGFSRVHHLFLPRAQQALASLWRHAHAHPDDSISRMLTFWVEQAIVGMSVMNRYQPIQQGRPGGSQVNRQLSGVYYVPSLIAEVSPRYNLELRAKRITKAFGRIRTTRTPVAVSTGDCAHLGLPDASADYIFTDPPFGENIPYSDLNFVVEAWHGILTTSTTEAIVDRPKGKALADYQDLMRSCFAEYDRILKPGRWMTVVFHNSSNAVWNAIQEAIQSAGFVIADVRTMDKQQGSYRQVTSTAAKQDLVISSYKPKAGFEQRFQSEAGTEQGAWDFVRQHLGQLPVFVEKAGRVEVVAERQNYLLYDRMIAFHIQRGATIPLSAASFYAGLKERFPERDGMYFTEIQAADYDQNRARTNEVEQLSIFVVDEKSAIQWLRAELADHAQTFQELQPKFLQELSQNRYEQLPELRNLLEQNFLEDPASHRWRVPDPAKQADMEALRQRALLAEFAEYLPGIGKLKRFRLEAIRAGVADLWAKRDYRGITRLAERLPDEVVQEDPALLMYYDNAVTREGGA